MADIARLYDFVDGTPAVADQVDAEFNQLYARINDLPNEALQNKAVDEAKLFPQNGIVRGNGGFGDTTITSPGGGWGDISGATVTFTPVVAAIALITAFWEFSAAPDPAVTNGQMQGRLAVDGVGQSEYAQIVSDRNDQVARATVGQVYRIALSAAPHTLKLQRNFVSGLANGGKFVGGNCGFTWWLLAQ